MLQVEQELLVHTTILQNNSNFKDYRGSNWILLLFFEHQLKGYKKFLQLLHVNPQNQLVSSMTANLPFERYHLHMFFFYFNVTKNLYLIVFEYEPLKFCFKFNYQQNKYHRQSNLYFLTISLLFYIPGAVIGGSIGAVIVLLIVVSVVMCKIR